MDPWTGIALHTPDDKSHPFTVLIKEITFSAAIDGQRTITNRTGYIFPAPYIKDFSVQGLLSSQKECKLIMTSGVTKSTLYRVGARYMKGCFSLCPFISVVVIIFGYWRTGKSVGFRSKENGCNIWPHNYHQKLYDYYFLNIVSHFLVEPRACLVDHRDQ